MLDNEGERHCRQGGGLVDPAANSAHVGGRFASGSGLWSVGRIAPGF